MRFILNAKVTPSKSQSQINLVTLIWLALKNKQLQQYDILKNW
jgi:hypothetical protein